MSETTVVVDAMGTGDPRVELKGAIAACKQDPALRVIMTGHETVLQSYGELSEQALALGIKFEHSEGIIAMGERDPVRALRANEGNNPMSRGVQLCKEGKAHAFCSAGHSGAVMAASVMGFRLIPGIDRPTIAVELPNAKGGVTILADAGIGIDSKAGNLRDYAVMASIYAQYVFKIEMPTVGLLGIGSEPGKGEERTKKAYELLVNCPLINFYGNVEGGDILCPKTNVVACDGTVGNIILKFIESMRTYVAAVELAQGRTDPLDLNNHDPANYGGVPILGLAEDATAILAHGASTWPAICKMILRAGRMADLHINGKIAEAYTV